MNFRKKALMIVCILSISMIMSSCNSEGNYTGNEQNNLSSLNVNDILTSEDKK